MFSPSADTGAATASPFKSASFSAASFFITTTLIVYSLTAALLFKLSNKPIAVLNCMYEKIKTIFITINIIALNIFAFFLITRNIASIIAKIITPIIP